jgi:penicillin amidase
VVLKGVTSTVEILRDRWGIPHIYADNLPDLFFGVGYAQAQDRLWQIDFNKRMAQGRLSEVLGEAALEIDRLIRRIGFRRAAERDWERATEDERMALLAFTEGVNAYTRRARLPLEFLVLRTRPELLHPVESLAFGRFLAWTLAGNWDSEIIRSWTIERFGPEMMAELEPQYPAGGPVIVPPGAEASGLNPDLIEDFREAGQIAGLVGQAMSNNWAVDGAKSVTGKPLLASDPHLPLSMPSIWWEVHMDSPELKVAGVALPTLPGVLMGHNDRIAWGMTAAIVDGDDFFVEQVNPDDPSQYKYRGKWVKGELVREEIKVRGKPKPVVEEVLVTRHGPVVSPAITGEPRTLSLQTVALSENHQIQSQLMLMRARNWEEFRRALSLWSAPSLNFAYADVDGNIGYQLAGRVPIRARGHGAVPMPGWTGEYEWTGFVPFEELPHSFNPPTHWVASANNKIVDDSYPHFLSVNYADSPRQKRIIEMLEEKEKLSLEDFKRMQVDILLIPARDLVPMILQLNPRDEWGQRALNFLKAWDHRVSADSVGACIFEVFFTNLMRLVLEEKIGSWSDFFLGKGVHPVRRSGLFFNVAHSWLVQKMRERPQWFEGKSWQEAMEEALANTVAELRRLLGDEVSRWQWGRLHKQKFAHPLGQIRGLDRLFNRGPVPIGGDANTIWQASYAPYFGYDVNSFTASWRQIIDLADFNRSLGVLPNGESGHPGSPHYQDMIPLWARGEYHPMLWDRDQVRKELAARLLIRPPSERRGDGSPRQTGDRSQP